MNKATDVFAAMADWPVCRHLRRFDPYEGSSSYCWRCLMKKLCYDAFPTIFIAGLVLIGLGIAGKFVPWVMGGFWPFFQGLGWPGKSAIVGFGLLLLGGVCGAISEN